MRSLRLLLAVLLAGCSDAPPATGGSSGSSSTTDTTGPGPVLLTGTGSTSTGVLDGTGTAGSTGSSGAGDTDAPQDCCSAHDAPGCDDPGLAACVCDQEAFCCAFGWDAGCVDLAAQCGGCGAATGTTGETTGGDEPSACCMPSGKPGCIDDPALETCVCGLDAFCCEAQWDDQCVQEAVRQCGATCEMGGDDCCAPSGSPGCPGDPAVEACVCAIDSFCCDTQWDGMCVESAQNDCGLVCMNGGGDCCAPSGGLGCDDMAVSDCVCALDPFCCDTQWDEICVSEAQYSCMDACGLPPANMGDCCMAQPGPGCDDMAVTDCACMIDGACCLFPWDDHCIELSVTACGIECAGVDPLPECCLVQPDAGCGDMDLEACVCAFDEFCCDTQWDGQCVDEALNDCALDCSGGGGTGGTGTSTG